MSVKSDKLDLTFSALADPKRRAILARLAQGEATMTVLAGPLDISLPAVSKHMRVLEEAGLVRRQRRGRHQVCRLNGRTLDRATDWISHHTKMWNDQLAQLASLLEEAGPR